MESAATIATGNESGIQGEGGERERERERATYIYIYIYIIYIYIHVYIYIYIERERESKSDDAEGKREDSAKDWQTDATKEGHAGGKKGRSI